MTNHFGLLAALKKAVGSTENVHQPASTNTVGAVLVFFASSSQACRHGQPTNMRKDFSPLISTADWSV